jgi:L-ascorbate metabolism protein UlaG (beta-lactamase superfamily)
VYHAGDTDFIPEMKDLNVDVALLPIGGTFTMTPEAAVEAAEAVNAKIAVPIHWGEVSGTRNSAERFVELAKAKGIDARIMNQER